MRAHVLNLLLFSVSQILAETPVWKWQKVQLECADDIDTYLNAIVWTGTQFMAVGDHGTILTSSEGRSWKSRHLKANHNLTSVVWTGTRFVAAGYNESSGASILTSKDGSTWDTHKTPTRESLHALAWTGNRLVAAGSKGTILMSSDGVVWTKQVSGTTEHLTAILKSGTRLLVVGEQGGLLVSSDNGVTWALRNLKGTEDFLDLQDLTLFHDAYTAVGEDGVIFVSKNTVDWERISVPTESDLYSVVSTGSRLVAGGLDRNGLSMKDDRSVLWESQDGKTWTQVYSGESGSFGSLVWTGRQLAAVDAGSCMVLLGIPATK